MAQITAIVRARAHLPDHGRRGTTVGHARRRLRQLASPTAPVHLSRVIRDRRPSGGPHRLALPPSL